MFSNEVWKDIKGYEGIYQVSSQGRIKALTRTITCKRESDNVPMSYCKKEKILNGRKDKDGYVVVNLSGKQKRVHQIVAEHFIPNLENKPIVDHINTLPSDNRVENLRWVTLKENSNNPLTKYHQSIAKLGKKASEETRRKISKINKGRKHTEETKKKMSLTRIGHPTSDETKRKIKNALIKKRVICLDTNEIFDCCKDASRKYGMGLWLALKKGILFKGLRFVYES